MKVLLTVDGSSYSDMSIRALKGLCLPPQSHITVMTVVPEQSFLGGLRLDTFRNNPDARKRSQDSQQQKAERIVQEATGQLDRKKFSVDTLVRWGKPVEQIADAIAQINADLVVVGAKGAGTSVFFPFGSTTQKIMKHVDCSVLVARDGAAHIDRVLLATDGSEHAVEATAFLNRLSLPPQTSIIAVTALRSHVSTYMRAPTLDFETSEDLLADLQTAEEEMAQELLDLAENQLREHYSEVLPLVVRGDPTQEILATAERFSPELIVLGAKGLGGHDTFRLGDVAKRVTKYAPCSALIVRPKWG